MPSIVSQLPQELRTSEHELLVLVQATEYRDGAILHMIDAPTFVKGRELARVTEHWTRRQDTRLNLLVLGAGVGSVPMAQNLRTIAALSVIDPDGTLVTLSQPNAKDWSFNRIGKLTAQRRDAMVTGLRTGAIPFEKLDKEPYEIHGRIEWPPEAKTKVANFLALIPVLGGNAPLVPSPR